MKLCDVMLLVVILLSVITTHLVTCTNTQPMIICNRELIRKIIVVCGLGKRSSRKLAQMENLPKQVDDG